MSRKLRREIYEDYIDTAHAYRRRDGEIVGPLQHDHDEWNPWYFTIDGRSGWDNRGKYSDKAKPEMDLVEELPLSALPRDRHRDGWHYDSQGYCDNPGRGY
jgi:hypothetical protein